MAGAGGAEPSRQYLRREAAQARAYSQAVVTAGGRTVWLAGQIGAANGSGGSLAGDFDGQVREVFARLGQTLAEAGGKLGDMVTMTVFITDARYGDRFTAAAQGDLWRQLSGERADHRRRSGAPGNPGRGARGGGHRLTRAATARPDRAARRGEQNQTSALRAAMALAAVIATGACPVRAAAQDCRPERRAEFADSPMGNVPIVTVRVNGLPATCCSTPGPNARC